MRWRHRTEAFECLITLKGPMQVPLLLVQTVSKSISLYLDLRNHVCQHGLSFKTRTASQGVIHARVTPRIPFLSPKNKQLNLDFLSGKLTSSSDLASYSLSRSSSVQRSSFYGDVIAIMSWAPDVVKLVCLINIYAVIINK